MKDIIRLGAFALRYKTYIDDRTVTSHDIEIVKYKKVDKSRYSVPATAPDEYCFQIAEFQVRDDCIDLVSCGMRLIDVLNEVDDITTQVGNIKKIAKLAQVAQTFLEADPYPVEIEPAPIRSWKYNTSTGLLDENN